MQKPAILSLAGLLPLFAVGGYLYVSQSGGDPFDPCRQGTVGGGAIGGPFTLVDETGTTVTETDVIDRPALVYFGFTYCPDVCPLDTVRNAEAVDILAEDGIEVRPVLISVDPDRDTAEVMAEYTDLIHPRLLGLTGSHEQVKNAAKAYKVYYRKQEGDPEDYLVEHTTFSYLMLPDHGFVEFFPRDVPAEDLAKTMACFVNAA